MNQRARNYIAKVAEFVLKEFKVQVPITDIDAVVTRLGGCIYSEDDNLVDSSVMRLDSEGPAFAITVSSCQPEVRRTFAIAQEIGHLFLHMGYLTDPDLWARFDHHMALDDYTEKEFRANEFAANFLMPEKPYMEFVSQKVRNQHIDGYAIAKYFGVPESCAAIRGKLIGALKWS